jgi:energy-coupling factor transporter ATP-binding protein EcfA2
VLRYSPWYKEANSRYAAAMAAPQPSEEILAWAKKQPGWRQDALRRILTKAFTKADEDECLELLKAAHGIGETKLEPAPLDAKHLPVRSTSATNLRLVALDDIANVNRLAKDAALSLASDGLTLIYGDNGSGKSGFIRILKKACRARDHERILPDVFAEKRANSPASARFTLEEGTTQTPITWLDDGKQPADALGRLAIFDSKCASVHVDGQNRLEVVPHNLDCFEKLAQVCDRLRDRLEGECESLQKQLAGALPEPLEGTEAEKFIAELSKKSEKDLPVACKWEPADQNRLDGLAGMLKDPVAEALRCERLATALREYADNSLAFSAAVSDKAIGEMSALKTSALELRAAANASAAAAFSSDPLHGVGEDTWRAMFDAARAYSEQHAYPGETFPVTKADAQCVLCQQDLSEPARDRFARFAGFVTGAMNAKAAGAEAARDAALVAIRPMMLAIPDLSKEARDYLLATAKHLGDECNSYREALLKRRASVLNDKDPLQPLPASPDVALRTQVASLAAAAKEARALAGAGAAEADALRKEHAELTGRKILHDNEPELKRRINIHQNIGRINTAMKGCATKAISDHGSKLLKTHVTEALAAALTDEQKHLGIDSIPLGLFDRTAKAVIQHRLRLNGATLAADTSAVLSEGEHRAVALAAFMSELRMYPGKDGIIIDDPVSSLDHSRRGKVAERLVGEAKNRQVIVFTHDLVFLSEVRYYAAQHQTPLRVIGVRRGPTGFGSLDPDGEPWLAKHLPQRRQWLSEQLARLKKLHGEASDDYEAQLRYFYDRLRESWERLIEEKLFAQVIGRFQPQVQTLRLKESVIDDEIVAQVHFGMTAVSSYTGHDRAAAKGGALADPPECEKDLKAFIGCLEQVDAKSKAASKAREAKIKAPKV